MRFSFTEEQEEFRVFLRRFLEPKSPTTEVRRLMDTDEGYDEAVWKQLSSELGLPAVHVPEEYGGQNLPMSVGMMQSEMLAAADLELKDSIIFRDPVKGRFYILAEIVNK